MSEAHEYFFYKVSSYISKLDGIEKFVIIDREGFPIEFRGVEKEEAEAQAALAVDLSTVIAEHLGEGEEIIVELGEGRALDLTRVRESLIVVHGLRRPVEEAVTVTRKAAKGDLLKCPHCGADLTLEVYSCKSCGKKIPFMSAYCPHCGANVSVKECPQCGGLLSTPSGRHVKLAKPRGLLPIVVLEGGVGGVVLASIAYASGASGPLTALAGIVGAVLVGGALYYSAPKTPVEV